MSDVVAVALITAVATLVASGFIPLINEQLALRRQSRESISSQREALVRGITDALVHAMIFRAKTLAGHGTDPVEIAKIAGRESRLMTKAQLLDPVGGGHIATMLGLVFTLMRDGKSEDENRDEYGYGAVTNLIVEWHHGRLTGTEAFESFAESLGLPPIDSEEFEPAVRARLRSSGD